MKIKFKLSILITAIMIVVIAALSFMILNRASRTSLRTALKNQHNTVSHQAQYWISREETRLQVIRTVAHIMAGYHYIPMEQRRDLFDNILHAALEAEPNLLQIYAIFRPNSFDNRDAQSIGRVGSTPTGQYAMTWTRETGTITARASADIEPTMAHINGPNRRNDLVEDPIARKIADKDAYVIRMMAPIIDRENNEVIGGVGLLLDVTPIQQAVTQLLATHEDFSVMAIYSGNGLIMGSYVPERVGQMLKDVDTIYGKELDRAYDCVIKGEEFYAKEFSEVLGTMVEIVMYPFQIGSSNMTWSVMLGTSENLILKDIVIIRYFTVVGALIAILISAIIVFLTLNFTTKPIVVVTETLRDISEGEGDLTRTIPTRGNDEISQLSTYFNKTLEKIKKLIVVIKDETVILNNIGDDLQGRMTETAAAVNEISANVQSIKTRVITQSTSVTETNKTMEQITININNLNNNVERQGESVSMSSSAIEEMLANIQSVTQTLAKNSKNMRELTSAADVGREALDDVAADIQEISRESEGLLDINTVMEAIASQTNLLSMNAAIEAAHAGEAGKGFAVVANEIRKLAEDSSEQSKTISNVLKKIKDAIDKITVSTDKVIKNFEAIDTSVKIVADQDENIHHAMEEQNEGSKQILEAISQLNEVTRLVKGATSEMLEGSEQVIKEGKNLDSISHEISGSMGEMSEGTDQINIAIHEVNEISIKNKETIDSLSHEISRFKVE
jgi:methyl-accepting chemotaxis protein